MPLLALLVVASWPQFECRTTNGNAACGFDCKTTNGQVACAQTPLGRCVATNGRVFCDDPRPDVLRSAVVEPMECVTTNGLGACGYDCKTTNGRAACARTPLGRCVTTNGQIFCGDPAPVVLRAGATEPMQCVTTNGIGACGYDCKTANGQARCATVPWGRCIAYDGRLVCSG